MPMLMICRYIVTWMLVLNRLYCSDSETVLILLVDGCPRIDSGSTHQKWSWFGFTVVVGNLVLLTMTLCSLAIALLQFTLLETWGLCSIATWHCLSMSCVFARTVISNFDWSVDWGKALSVESKLLLVHALVQSRLDYCNSVLTHLPWSLVQQLQSVLNSAARLIFGLKRFDHIIPALMDLHWLPYPQRITYKLCMIMFKCLRGSAPAYLADYCTSTSLVPGRSALRSAAHGDIVVPSHRTDWGLRSFVVAGPSSWNVLPVGLRCSSFRFWYVCKALKTHLSIWFSILMTGHKLLSLYYFL